MPHSNPVFGGVFSQVAVAARNSQIALSCGPRTMRIRQIRVSVGTDVRVGTVTGVPITTVVSTHTSILIPYATLGPDGALLGFAIADAGHSAARVFNFALQPEQVQFDLRPPLLIVPGSSLFFEDATQNTTLTVGVIWDEIPREGETTELGFPE